MFLGTYEHTLDTKGRMTIPVKYRELVSEGAYITKGFDQNLMVLTNKVFQSLFERVTSMNMADPTARELRRLMFANAFAVEFDKAGRILIPQILRTHASLDGEAVILGNGSYFEIWSPTLWQDHSEKVDASDAKNERYATLDLSL
jgi:MraZ protein